MQSRLGVTGVCGLGGVFVVDSRQVPLTVLANVLILPFLFRCWHVSGPFAFLEGPMPSSPIGPSAQPPRQSAGPDKVRDLPCGAGNSNLKKLLNCNYLKIIRTKEN